METVDEYYEPQFINVAADEESDMIEVPAEDNGTLLLSVIQAHFPNALGLKYRSPSGAWRAVRIADGLLDPPHEGWLDEVRYVVSVGQTVTPAPSSNKRKLEESSDSEPAAKVRPDTSSGSEPSVEPVIPSKKEREDIIVLGLAYSATAEDVQAYFEKYGAVKTVEIKKDYLTGRPKGFGFVKFEDSSVTDSTLGVHTILDKECTVRKNVKKTVECKLYIGKLPTDATKDDMQQLFGAYGELTDVFVPQPGRGFGFITFKDKDDAKVVLKTDIRFKDKTLTVKIADPKPEPGESRRQQEIPPHRGAERPIYRDDPRQPPLERELGLPGLLKLLENTQRALARPSYRPSPPRERFSDSSRGRDPRRGPIDEGRYERRYSRR